MDNHISGLILGLHLVVVVMETTRVTARAWPGNFGGNGPKYTTYFRHDSSTKPLQSWVSVTTVSKVFRQI